MTREESNYGRARLLLVEDNSLFAIDIKSHLTAAGHEVVATVSTGEEAIQRADELRPELMIVDVNLSGPIDGIQATEIIRSRIDTGLVYVTAYSDDNLFERAKKTMPHAFVLKPVTSEHLVRTVDMALSRHRLEKRLRESEVRYRTLVETMNEGVATFDERGSLTFANARFAEILGYEPAELMGRSGSEFVHEDQREAVCERFNKNRLGTAHTYETLLKTGSGGSIPATVTTRPVFDTNNRFAGSLALCSPMLPRDTPTTIEKQTPQRDEFVSNILEALRYPVFVVDANDYSIKVANHAAHTGPVPEHCTCHSLIYGRSVPCDRDGHRCPVQEVKNTRQPVTLEQIRPDDGGRHKIVEIHAYPIFDEDGEVAHVIQSMFDVTDRRNAEGRLRESEERFRQLAENVGEVFWLTHPGKPKRVVYLSRAHERVWGVKREEFYTNAGSWLKSIHPEDRDYVVRRYEDFLDGLGDYSVEYRIVRPDGSTRWIWDRAFPIVDDRGSLHRVAGLAQDITARKIEEDKQRALIEERKHFAFIVSHDLRGPLVNVSGFTQEVEMALDVLRPVVEQALPSLPRGEQERVAAAWHKDLPESLQFIHSSIVHMDGLIDSILNLSRLGRADLNLEFLDMNDVVNRVVKTMAHEMSEKGVEISVGNLPEAVAGKMAMEQIFGNLLANAIKYRDKDRRQHIQVVGHRFPEETYFVVKDSGRGIQSNELTGIFNLFQRGGKQDVPGEGMGLAYARTLVRRHGGRIWCESQPGVGSTFTFTVDNNLVPGQEVP